MGRVTLKNLFAKKFRLVLTSLAVVLGVAFMSGTFVLTDTLGSVFDNLFATTTQGVDAVVRGKEPFKSQGRTNADSTRPPVPDSLVPVVRRTPGVADAQGNLLRYALVEDRNGQAIQNQAPAFGVAWYPAQTAVNQSLELVPQSRAPGRRSPPPPTRWPSTSRPPTTAATGSVTGSRSGSPRTHPTSSVLPGVFKFGGSDQGLAGATLAAFTPDHRADGHEPAVPAGHLGPDRRPRAVHGLSETPVRDRLSATLRNAGLRSVRGDHRHAARPEQSNNIKNNLSFFNTFLLDLRVGGPVRRRVHHLQHLLDHGRAASPRARSAPRPRRVRASGRRVGGAGGVRRRVAVSVLGLGLGILLVIPLEGLLAAPSASASRRAMQIQARTSSWRSSRARS